MAKTSDLPKVSKIPSKDALVARFKTWWASDSRYMAISMTGHAVVLLIVACIPMANPEIFKQEAPAFDAKVDQAVVEQDFQQFELGDPPLDPTELSTESLTIMEPVAMEAQTEEINDESPTFEHRGGGSSTDAKATAIGGLGGFDIDAVGSGPAVRGGGGAGAGFGSGGAGSGGLGGSGFGGRGSGMRKAMLASGGGTKGTEKAVQGGLVWFARHQNPDGSWSLDQHYCKDRACTCGGEGDLKQNAAATAFALLPFLAAGQTHETEGQFKSTVDRGLGWLVKNQKQDGNLSATGVQVMYTHGLASIAMCEAFGLTKDKRLLAPAQAAINFIQNAQDKETGGWWYSPGQKGGDTSVFGWQLMALKSAQMAGLTVNPATLSGAQKWLKSVSKGTKGGLFSYTPASGASPTMSSVGLLATQYLGAQRNDPRVIEGMNYFLTQMPNPKARNCYYWYYATQVLHNLPGPEWDRWNREMRRVLIESQVKDGCAVGSWDPNQPTPDPHGKTGGRVMVTAIATLTLEVYYRYLPLYQLDPEATASK
jgi:hypothetical protein